MDGSWRLPPAGLRGALLCAAVLAAGPARAQEARPAPPAPTATPADPAAPDAAAEPGPAAADVPATGVRQTAADVFGDPFAESSAPLFDPAAGTDAAPPATPEAPAEPAAAGSGSSAPETPPVAPAAGGPPTDPSPADAAPPAPAPRAEAADELPDAARLSALRAGVEAKSDVPEEVRAAALAEVDAAVAARAAYDAAVADRAAAEAAAAEAERVAAELKAAAEAPPAEPDAPPADASDADLAAAKAAAEAEVTRLKEAKASRAAPPTAAEREATLARLRDAADAAAKAADAARLAAAADGAGRLGNYARLRAELEAAAARARLAAAQADKTRGDVARARGLPALRAAAEGRAIEAAEARLAKLTEALARRRRAEAEELAAADAAPVPEPLRELAGEVAELGRELQEQTSRLTAAETAAVDRRGEAEALRDLHETTENRVDLLGLTDASSRRLRRDRAGLPDLAGLDDQLARRRAMVDEAYLAATLHEDALADLPDPEAEAAEAVARADAAGLSGAAREAFKARAADLLARRRKQLLKLEEQDEELVEALLALQTAETDLREATAEFAEFIDERVLWVRSGPPLLPGLLREEIPELAGLAAPGAVGRFADSALTAVAAAARQPGPLALGAVVVALLGFVRLRLRGELARRAVPARRKGTREFRPTAGALAVTVLAACAGPAAAFGAAWVLGRGGAPPAADGGSVPESLSAAALSAGLYAAAAAWLPLSLLRAATRRDGLGPAHFDWPAATAHGVHREVKWFTAPILLTALAAGMLGSADPQHAGGAWERVLFATCALLWAWLAFRLLRPRGPVWSGVRRAAPDSPSLKLAVPLWALFAGAGAGVAALSVAGYHYTAGELARRSVNTVALVVAVVLLRGAAVRWVTVSRRSMLYATLLRKRKERVAREEASDLAGGAKPGGPGGGGTGGEAPAAADDAPDAAALSLQTRSLVTAVAVALGAVGLWFVWADVLPALKKLEDVTFPSWTVPREVPDPAAAVPEGGERPTKIDRLPISLNDLLVAAFAAVATVFASRNLPAVLELGAFRRLPLDAGGRYAFTRLVSYAAVVAGVLFTAGTLGFEWENVQWLVAALSVGLGFGLQEVVANFVCGLIILFERPVRVGDVVTVDDVTGVVSRIRIRATTITNWDRKEFIVPNKEFVTGRLLNWTLSDNTNRIVIEVGVAYGTDTERALALLQEVCREEPLVLSDPAPLTTFEGFGDSTLNLILRCYLPSLDQRLPVVSALHTAIDRKFREHDIEIAFPQRDLHLRSVPRGLSTPATAGETSGGEPPTDDRPTPLPEPTDRHDGRRLNGTDPHAADGLHADGFRPATPAADRTARS